MPPMIDLLLIVVDASRRNGATTSAANARATPPPSNCSRPQRRPSAAAVIEPPDTLDTRSSLGRNASSFSRHNAPTWKSIARYPPPDRHKATPGSSVSVPSAVTGDVASSLIGILDLLHCYPGDRIAPRPRLGRILPGILIARSASGVVTTSSSACCSCPRAAAGEGAGGRDQRQGRRGPRAPPARQRGADAPLLDWTMREARAARAASVMRPSARRCSFLQGVLGLRGRIASNP